MYGISESTDYLSLKLSPLYVQERRVVDVGNLHIVTIIIIVMLSLI